jgi:serine/threonine protein kinase
MTAGEAPRIVAGRYVLYGALASGGMATVHLGRLTGAGGFSRTVAIKRLHEHLAHDAQFAAGFLEEARLNTRIAHPNVVPTLDVIATDEQLLLVMEYIHGESLSRLVRAVEGKHEQVPLRIAVAVVAGVLHGLHAAHEATDEMGEALRIVHRDVSPQNVMLGVDGVPRVLDFGVAKAAGRLRETVTGQMKGKLAYMAPEQVTSEPVDRRTDVFAASVILWELLTSKRLFTAESDAATMGNLLHQTIDPPSTHAAGLAPALDAVVMRGLSRDPAGRFPTAKEMALALEDLVPVATATQTGAWVTSLAGDALSERAKRIREIETASTSMRPPALLDIQELPTKLPVRNVAIADIIARNLAAYLGAHTAKVAVRTFSMRALGRGPETLSAADLPALVTALRPMLRTFIGRAQCEWVLSQMLRELET